LKSTVANEGKKKEVLGIGGITTQLLQICMDYPSLPPVRDITIEEIQFFYEPLIPGLIERQKTARKTKSG
jgi:hypothetical protein